jgi:hypothetical protein
MRNGCNVPFGARAKPIVAGARVVALNGHAWVIHIPIILTPYLIVFQFHMYPSLRRQGKGIVHGLPLVQSHLPLSARRISPSIPLRSNPNMNVFNICP